MTDRQSKHEAGRQRSVDAFVTEKVRFDALLAELQCMSADHFSADPDAVLWGNVGDLKHLNGLLAQVVDAYFRRGEHAA